MKTKLLSLLAAVVCSCALTLSAADSVSVLLQKGIFAEETEGNLDSAIQIYQKIVEESEANRSVAAQAQYRLGMCQMKRGKKDEAESAFRKIISQFADQTDVAAIARERITELGKTVSSVVVRQVWSSPDAAGDSISRDGRYLAFIDWNTGNLAVRDLTKSQNLRLTDDGSWQKPAQWAESCALSPDGKQIAYNWYNTNECYELRLLNLPEPKPRVLMRSDTNGWISAEDWSPDGRSIAVLNFQKQGTNWKGGISIIGLPDGVSRNVASLGQGLASTLRFSPDGRYLTYNLARERPANPRARLTNDIFVIDVRTGTRKLAVEHFAHEQFAGWSPHGSEILFTSERRESVDLWLVQVENGEAKGQPKLMKSDLGNVEPIGMTRDGAFFYSSSPDWTTLYEAAVDVSAGKLLAPLKALPTRFPVSKSAGPKRLSPDGRFLAFVHQRGNRPSLHLEDLMTGQVREITIPGVREYSWPYWSSDSQFFHLRAFMDDRHNGLFLVNRVTGETSVLAPLSEGNRSAPGNDPYGWFGFDNGTACYSINWPGKNRRTLVWHDVKSGAKREKEISNLPDTGETSWRFFNPSPDGKALFYIRPDQAGGASNWVATRRDFATGKEMEFLRSSTRFTFIMAPMTDGAGHSSPHYPIVLSFRKADGSTTVKGIDLTSDSATERFSVDLPVGAWVWPHLFGSKPQLLCQRESELWVILGQNNEIRKIELGVPGMGIIGNYGENHILFEKRESPSEIWVMENFLPAVSAKAP
ncbi:MAG: tetratricopeptide repeat protein [Chloroflexi bacterium]|nr:tetratricopeptide repeat protein [Chloroflexota bacterium]